MKGDIYMQQLLQAVLEDSRTRHPGALTAAASQAASEFSPWGAA